jgi:SAM-dependent methyltransferase
LRKIFTIRNIDAQREHMWSARRIEEEVAACPRRRIARYFMEYLPKGEPILEAGCGLGAWVIYLGDRGYDIAGIDNDAQVIGRLKEWRPSLNVSAGDIRALPCETGSLGAVISLGVMEHFEEGCDEAMRETFRVLRPGGLFFFTVPLNNIFRKLVAHPLRGLYLRWKGAQGDGIHFAEFRYTPAEVERMLARHGFTPFLTTWDDFSEKGMSLGIWADFPPLHGKGLYEMNVPGRAVAWVLNSLSPWLVSAGVLCIARKKAK